MPGADGEIEEGNNQGALTYGRAWGDPFVGLKRPALCVVRGSAQKGQR